MILHVQVLSGVTCPNERSIFLKQFCLQVLESESIERHMTLLLAQVQLVTQTIYIVCFIETELVFVAIFCGKTAIICTDTKANTCFGMNHNIL